MAAAISRATFSMKLKSTEPSGCGGVGTAMKITSDFSTPSAVLLVKVKPAGGDVFLHQFLQARLVNGDAAGLEQFDLGRVVIHADDLVADFGEAGAGDQADVAGADDGQFHGRLFKLNEAGGDKVGDAESFDFNCNMRTAASAPSGESGLSRATHS